MSNREILYIEDNVHNRRIVRKILERQGYTLHEREDGLEGYEFLKELKPGIVLLDISLPTMDGMEIARRVKEDLEVQHIYLIALTASAMQGDRERFLEAGCDDYLSKPFRALDLVDLVDKYADLVEANVPAPPPQPSELHDTWLLETKKVEVATKPETEIETELKSVALPDVKKIVEVVEVEPEGEEVITDENGSDGEVEPMVEVIEATGETLVKEIDDFEKTLARVKPSETTTDYAEDLTESPESDEITPIIEQEDIVGLPQTVAGIEITKLDLSSNETELFDEIPVLFIEQDKPVPQMESEQDHSSATQVNELPKKNDSLMDSRRKRRPEEINAIRARIMGVINPGNLKPVDPNNHRE